MKGDALTVRYAPNARVVLALLLTIITALVGCSPPEKSRFEYFRVTIDGEQVLGISAKLTSGCSQVLTNHGQ